MSEHRASRRKVPFVHLAARTAFSLRDGVIQPEKLAVATWERGMGSVGVADRDGLYGAVRVAEACRTVGVKPIFGADLALRPDPRRPGWTALRSMRAPATGQAWLEDGAPRVILLARTQTGYAALCRLVTDHHLDAERGNPHATWAHLQHWVGRGGLFVLLAEDSPVGRLLAAGRADAAAAEARRWMELVGRSSVLVGVTHHLAPGDDARARAWFALADRLGLRAVAHQAPRYLRRRDAHVADVLDAVRRQVPLDPRHISRRNAEGFFKSPEEMAAVFAERPDAVTTTAWVAERCQVDLGLGRLRVPDLADAPGDPAGAMGVLRQRCEAGLAERYPMVGTRHRQVLTEELEMVAQLGLAPYFLTVAEVVDRIREKGIMVACRGSAAGSIVTYALRISDVDPIAHDLAWQRFMNPYRDELPDIDIDVESSRRIDIYRDLLARYGEDRVAGVCMVETFRARMAIREVGKAMGLPAGEVDHIAKSFPHIRAGDVRAAIAQLPELADSNLGASAGAGGPLRGQLGLLFDVVERMDALPRHLALHPSGVLLADRGLRDLVPMQRSAAREDGAGFAMAQFDKDDVERLGLCKLDVLSVRMLSSMSHCLDEVCRVRRTEIDLDRVAWDDDETYELIRSTRTLGCFQIESPGQRELIGKLQPEHLDDLVVDISLFRPGPVKGDMVGPFLQRRLQQAKTVSPHPALERALAETFGVIVYHEQVMRCVAALTGCDLSVADLVRRRLDDPEGLDDLHAWVIAGACERGVGEENAESLWQALAQFASFGFCKAHAAAFAVPTYRSAWLKTHYLPEFVAGLLTHDPGMYPRRLLLEEARQFGVCVLPLDVNRSERVYRVERVPTEEAYRLLGVGAAPAAPSGVAATVAPSGTAAPAAPSGVAAPVAPSGRERPFSPLRSDGGSPSRGLPRGWTLREGGVVPPAGADKGVDSQDPAWRFGIRLALQDVAGITEEMIDSLLTGRPFTSVADLRRRTALSAPVAEALAHVGALDDVAGAGQPGGPSRRDVLLEVVERWPRRPATPAAPEQIDLLPADGPAGLPDYRPSERVRAELEVLGLDATAHVISFYDDLLDVLGVTRAVHLLTCADGQPVRVAGVKVATQTPPVKSGQRVIFLSLDDGTGVSDAAFFESVHDRCAWTVFHSWLLVVEGSVRRTGRRGVSLNAETAWDLRRLMQAWRGGTLDTALRDRGRLGGEATGERTPKLWHSSGGSAGR